METETGKVSGLEDLNNQDENSRSDSRVCKRVTALNSFPRTVVVRACLGVTIKKSAENVKPNHKRSDRPFLSLRGKEGGANC